MESADGPVFNQGRHEGWADVCAKLRAILDADDARHWNMDGLLKEVQRLAKGAKQMKRWYESKLIWLGVLTVLGAVADGLAAGWGWRQLVVAGIGALIGVLRLATTKEITSPPAGPSLLLPLVLCAGLAGGCGGQIDWGKVISAAGIVIQGGSVVTTLTCQALAAAGAPADDVQRCLQAERAAAQAAKLAPVVGAVIGAWTNAGTLEVQGVGTVQVRAMAPAACPVGEADKPPIGFTTPVPAHD